MKRNGKAAKSQSAKKQLVKTASSHSETGKPDTDGRLAAPVSADLNED